MSVFRFSLRVVFFPAFIATLSLALLLGMPLAHAGGTPDPGSGPLTPTNRNALLEILGPDRSFDDGDYVTNATSGLQRVGAVGNYNFFIEVPPGQSQLVVQIFDADAGAGDNLATPAVNEDAHDGNSATNNWDMTTRYQLFDADGLPVVVRQLAGQDCDPNTAGLQNFCDNTWSDLGAFTIDNPSPGRWRFTVGSPNNAALNSEDESNSYGIRAHDGDPSAAGNEFPVYVNSLVGIGQVHASSAGADPGLSRTNDFFPFVRRDCTCESNDFDADSTAPIDESTVFTTRKGVTPTGSGGVLSQGTRWRQSVLTNWTTEQEATDYGLWRLRWTTGSFNHITYYMGDESNFDPSNAAPGPGNGVEPKGNPSPGGIRLYLPADGSRMFGLAGGGNDVITAPRKPWVGQSWAVRPSYPQIEGGVQTVVDVTITVANPTAYPIQFSDVPNGTNVMVVTVPNNGGQTTYLTNSANISGGGANAVSVAGNGPWNIRFAPGVIAAGATAKLTYTLTVLPSRVGIPKSLLLTGGLATGTVGAYIDESCASVTGGASVCTEDALGFATTLIGPLCQLSALVSTAPSLGLAHQINGPVTDNGNGTVTVPFRLVVKNLGTTTITALRVSHSIPSALPPVDLSISPIATSILSGTGVLAANSAYDGVNDQSLLISSSSYLNSGASGQIDFNVTLNPSILFGPYIFTPHASGTSSLGSGVWDIADNGTEPDSDGDGEANEYGINCPSTVPADNCENDPTIINLVAGNPVVRNIPATSRTGLLVLLAMLGLFGVIELRRAHRTT